MARFPRSVFGVGSEPDPRFSLANERTFLAWNRTALALIAAGVALEALNVPIAPGFRLAAAIVFVCLGALAVVQAWLGWAQTEKALRLQRALPGLRVGAVVVVGVLVALVLVMVGSLL